MMPDNSQNNAPTTENKPKGALRSIRTLGSDLSEAIKRGQTSLTDVYLKQRVKPDQTNREQKQKQPKKILLFALVILFAALISTVIFILLSGEKQQTVNRVPKIPPSIIPSQKEARLSAYERSDFENSFKKLIHRSYNAGDLIYIPVEKSTESGATSYLNAANFLNFLKTSAPPLLTSCLKENFLLGILNLEKNHPLLILEVEEKNYDSAFAGMLKWEKNLLSDLNFLSRGDSAASPSFEDEIITNQSARVLKKDGGTILLYSVFNKKYIIIVEDSAVLKEIIHRFILFKFS